MRRSVFVIATLLASFAAAPGHGQSLSKLTVGMGSPVLDASVAANVGVPIALGYWKAEGLDVSVQPGNATMHLQALLGGQEDIMYGGPATAFQAIEKGAKLRLVYLFVRKNIYYPVVLQNSKIKTVSDLKGKTVGVASYASQLTVIMKGIAKNAGMDPAKDLHFVEVGVGPQAISALRSGRVDAWATFDAQIAGAEESGLKLRLIRSPYLKKLDLAALYIVRQDFYEKHKEVLGKFFRGIAKGTLFAKTNPEGAIHALWRAVSTSKPVGLSDDIAMSHAMAILKVRLPEITPAANEEYGEMTPMMVNNYQDFLVETGRVKKKIDPKSLLTPDVWRAANNFDKQKVVDQAKAYK